MFIIVFRKYQSFHAIVSCKTVPTKGQFVLMKELVQLKKMFLETRNKLDKIMSFFFFTDYLKRS